MRPLIRLLLACLAGVTAVSLVACSSTATTSDTGTTGSSTSLDGKALVEERCTVCHPLTQATSKRGDADAWSSIVDNMIGKGAQLSSEERQAVIDYLATTYPAQ